jgi:vitamin B12 transporter
MHPLPFRATAIAAVALLCVAAAAADPAPVRSPDACVVVTASRETEAQFDTLVPVTVIDRDMIERSMAQDVGDLLRLEAGIDVAQSGGAGQPTSIFMRGTNSNHTALLVDGVRINPGTLGVPAVQNIAPELVDHIEIVKGPMSTLYGTDAIGGVINVITRHPDGVGADTSVGYGRYDTRQGAFDGYLGDGTSFASAAVSWLESAGFPTQAQDTTDRSFRNLSGTLAARSALGGLEFGARLWHAKGTTHYYDGFSVPVDQNVAFEDSAYAVDVGGQLTSAIHTRLLLSQALDEQRQRVPLNPAPPPLEYDYATTRRTTLDWQNSALLAGQQLTFGGILSFEHARSLVFGTNFDVDTRADSWYVQDRTTLGRQRLQAALGYTRHGTFGDHTTWNLEYGFAPTAATLLTVGWGTAFRAPDATDRYGFDGNPLLKPESARNLELGLRERLGMHQTLAVAAFYNRIDDLIQFYPTPTAADPYEGITTNVGRARIAGVEAAWEYLDADWNARLKGSV